MRRIYYSRFKLTLSKFERNCSAIYWVELIRDQRSPCWERNLSLHTDKRNYHMTFLKGWKICDSSESTCHTSSLKVSKEWDICWRLRKRLKCPLFLVREGPKNSRGCGGMLPGKSFKFARNAASSPPSFFLALFARNVHVIMVSLS